MITLLHAFLNNILVVSIGYPFTCTAESGILETMSQSHLHFETSVALILQYNVALICSVFYITNGMWVYIYVYYS